MNWPNKKYLVAGALPLLTGLVGCEAQLNLDGVKATLDQSVRRTDLLHDIAANDRFMVVVGDHGVVLTSPRAASPNWRRTELDTSAVLVDATTCPDGSFAVLASDRRIWTAAPAAADWVSYALPTTESVLSLTCTPDGTLWVGGSFSTLLKSVDGGSDWESQSMGEDAMLTGIQFLDAETGFAVGEFGLVLRTDDAGMQWRSVSYIPNEFYPQSVWFQNDQQGWVTGLAGTILRTDDGGVSWQPEATGVAAPLYGIGQAMTSTGETVQYALGDHSTLLVRGNSTDWLASVVSPSPGYLRNAVMVNDRLFAVGAGGAVHAIDLVAALNSPSVSREH